MRMFNEVINLTHRIHVRHDLFLAKVDFVPTLNSMATEKRMLGVHLTEAEHTLAKALAEKAGESLAVLFRQWLRAQARKHGIAPARLKAAKA